MAGIFDSHAHYDDTAFDIDRYQLLPALHAGGVEGILNCASHVKSALTGIRLAQRYPFIWCAAGIHPEEAAHAAEKDLILIEKLLSHPKVVAVGEIGLDYHYEDACPRDIQRHWFKKQLEMAARHELPVVVHDREAHEDTLRLLRESHARGVIHCFSGSVEMAREAIRRGLYIGLGGVVTFKNARKAVEVAADIPLDRLLLETDAPYMAPVPFRGKRCDSSMIAHTAAKIADLRGITVEHLLAQNRQNIRALFGI